MLTRKQHELICFIEDRLAETGISPSFEEMKEARPQVEVGRPPIDQRAGRTRFSPPLAQPRPCAGGCPQPRTWRAATASKACRRQRPRLPSRATPRAAEIANIIELPLHGRIAAGVPIEAFEDHSNLAVFAALLGPGDHYALEVSGDSMVEAGILNGDYALIKRADTAREGDIAGRAGRWSGRNAQIFPPRRPRCPPRSGQPGL